ncbi:cell division protein FtsL [Seinonella peptonophila]|uniref:Cell division protein FtsL n=1 Tax=Seinonella peptonophila TaxID=112248 RepID=A0A1M4UZZ0_9BACL|nr:cell division protein FtsL [Seinonella peptonophila]SHE62286.1 cell division protein FtsL [Seinonella peptonophila]
MRENQGNAALAYSVEKQNQKKLKAGSKKAPRIALPVGEKLLYLFSIVVCVLLASVVLAKYAEVTALNVSIQEISTEVEKTKEVNLQLESEKKRLGSMERVRKFAEEQGLQMKATQSIPSVQQH